jgi:hypothetical protein
MSTESIDGLSSEELQKMAKELGVLDTDTIQEQWRTTEQ